MTMNPVRKKLAVAMLSTGSIAALFAGSSLIRSNNIARADDAPAQGKVQERVTVSAEQRQQLEGLAAVFKKVGHSVEPSVVNITVRKSGKATRPPGYDDMLRRFFPDNDGDGQPDLPEGFNEDAEK